MNTFKGTPGAFAQDGFNLLAVIAEESKGKWLKIADCRINDDTDIDVEKANCRLFAASKQLLEALQEIIPLIEKAHKSAVNKAVYIPLEQSLSKAKAAISVALD